MPSLVSFSSGLLVLVFVTACVWGQESSPGAPTDGGLLAEKVLSSPLNTFTAEVFRLSDDHNTGPGNLISSPLSLATALSLLLLGARGPTDQLIRKTLGLNGAGNADEIHKLFHDLITGRISSSNSSFDMANLALLKNGPEVMEEVLTAFSERASAYYLARVEQADFAKEGTAIQDKVNSQVEVLTHGKIQNLLPEPLPQNTVFLLLNVIYFREQWAKTFDVLDTRSLTFYNSGDTNSGKETDFLVRRSDRFRSKAGTIGGQAVKSLQLEYKDKRTAMVVILPDEINGLTPVLTSARFSEDLAEVLRELDKVGTGKIDVYLPKFNINSDINYKDTLTDLGLGSLFTFGADLTAVNGDPAVHLSAVKQRAFISVDETGTEAAVVTQVVGTSRSGFRGPVFRADHPFLFLIRDLESGLIFFMGKLVNL